MLINIYSEMNNKISVRSCNEYNFNKVYDLVSDIYTKSSGPEVKDKKVLLKPNILNDSDPGRCISTHPVVVEAMIRLLQSKGATVFVGDSPAVHRKGFSAVKSGISKVCETTGAEWVDFIADPVERKIGKRSIRIAGIVDKVDLIISLPKFKNHELMYFTGAIKNTLGLVPGFSKAKQHGLHRDRNSFGQFLVDLNEEILPDYFLMDGIMGMEGPGPGSKGIPVSTGVLLGSTNPLALDITASRIAGYNPMVIPTTKTAYFRKKWLGSESEIIYDGPDPESLIKVNFRKIPVSGNSTSGLRFIVGRTQIFRKLERRPVFLHDLCTGCKKCVDICPADAIHPLASDKKHIVLTDSRCIRCFCCAEACTDSAIDVRVKMFGV
jgi:uncharacterized protein (DUF362 family)/Pyruvate/2-oxoacid:ferredoxin oxidoreductase delta subunit